MAARALSKARLARMHDVMAGHVERGQLPGLVTLVSRHDEVVVDAIGCMAIGGTPSVPVQRDTIFRIASMTKPVVAAATMILVEECKLGLDDAVDRLLPELANRQVLKRPDAPLDETVPAKRGITVRDLLTFRLGTGMVLAPPGKYPIQKALSDLGLAPGPNPPAFSPDEWMRRIGTLPLIHQPGERWMYHTGSDLLGVLIARASGQPLERFLDERIFAPLGMKDTGFFVPLEKAKRLPPSYAADPKTGSLALYGASGSSRWTTAPTFPSGGGGLVSTVDDYHTFCRMLLNQGRHGAERVLSRPSVELMTTNQLTAEQLAGAELFLGSGSGWGFGVAVVVQRTGYGAPGRFGWDGGYGTSAHSDPVEDLVGILMTQRMMDSPEPPRAFVDFWTSTYQAIDD